MVRREQIRKSLRVAVGPALALVVLAAGGGYIIFGPTGLYAWGDYSQQLKDRRAELSDLKQQQAELKNRVELLDPQRTDPDMADELVRRELNVTSEDEIIVPLK